MNTKTTAYAFTHNSKGTKIAYRWSPRQFRYFRVGIEEAELAIATGTGEQVEYINYRNGIRLGN